MTADVPRGQRFSHVYVARGEPTQDSPRMRRRIASLIGAIRDLYSDTDFEHVVEEKLGIASPRSSSDVWTGLLAKWELIDVLDLVTVGYRFLQTKRSRGMYDPGSPERWRSTIETAAMSKRHGTRSKKLGNAVPKRGDPDAVYCDCEPDHCHRPSRPNSRTGFCGTC